ncbi:MAG TPA: YegS/Rv2252/BmrU family lipid kinase [Candidatus Aphodomonas merdavium]|nr:YegS/Rv2252/BmrU family lipid kinase [Candidatus Aphodomonas merdavium]
MKKLLFILNPNAGMRQARRALADVIGIFSQQGWLSSVCVTGKRGDATDFARAYGGEVELVVCAGGDGTLNETVTGLLQGGYTTPVGYLPCGSTNDFAASLKIPTNLLAAARCAVEGNRQALDIGRFQEKYFCYTASFGAFTQASYTTPQNVKNVLGHAAYVLEGIKDIPSIRPLPVRLKANGETYEGQYVFGAVCNSTSLGGMLKLDPGVVDMNDGLFETLLVKMPTNAMELQDILTALTTRRYENRMLTFIRSNRLVFEVDKEMPWTLDGEFAQGEDEIVVENLHSAITMALP